MSLLSPIEMTLGHSVIGTLDLTFAADTLAECHGLPGDLEILRERMMVNRLGTDRKQFNQFF